MKGKNKLVGVICVLALAAAVAAGFAMTGCGSEWNISGSKESSVTARLVKKEDSTYCLVIEGKGFMKSWNSPSDVPWVKQADRITEVSIADGITSIGSNALKNTAVKTAVLPTTIVRVSSDAVNADTILFTYDAEIEYNEGIDANNIYLYSENKPKTADRYWQSDMSKGDIVEDDETLESGSRFWHFDEDGAAQKWNFSRVLFIGNSFTYRNGVVEFSSGVPGIFDGIAEDLGWCTETYSVTGPGWYLENHAKATDTCGKQVDKLLRVRDDFDFIVLQEQSTNPFENYNRFIGGVKALKEKIEATQKNAKIYLYETWGSPYSAEERKISVPAMELKLREAYEKAGKECGLDVSYIGRGFTDIYRHEKSINLYASDRRHQGYTGAYLSGATHVASMLGLDVRNTQFKGDPTYKAPELADEVLTALRTAAYNTVFAPLPDEEDEKEKEPEQTEYSLEVAVWGRWITETQFTALFDGFKEYCKDKSLDATKIHYTYYTGAANSDPYYYIAEFTKAVVNGGGADIVFPCATNLTTQSGTNITQALAITKLDVTLNGKTDRCIAKLKDTDISSAFCDFCLSNEGKSILDPGYKAS